MEYEGGQSVINSLNSSMARNFRSLNVFGPYGDKRSEIIENAIISPQRDVKIYQMIEKRVE